MPATRLDDEPNTTLSARDPRLDTWRAFLTAHALLTRRLDEDLRAEEGLTLGEYSALLQVAEAPGRALRMNQLATGIFLSRSGVTRLIDRLEADGLIQRSTCTDDGRGALAVLTDAGLERLRAAADTHLAGIAQYFLDVVPGADLEVLTATFRAIGERVRADGEPICAPSE
ncbi:MAG TPA: MarR family transcriptional regulator [Candidatus Limnocylindrales bacterium]|nr:MarR family transcriptional regulator [Candidatus Limnocylindrales bacterium]